MKNGTEELHIKMGIMSRNMGDLDESINEFDMALGINNRSISALNNKGISLKALGKKDEAIKCWKKALEIEPNDYTVKMNLQSEENEIVPSQNVSEFLDAVADGLVEKAIRLAESGIDVNSRDENGCSALSWACRVPAPFFNKNRERLVDYLLDMGADVNSQDQEGRTALMHASKEGNLTLVKKLIKNGAKVNLSDNYGNTAIKKAGVFYDIIDYLKECS